jgi:hypothetical protein
MKSGKQRKQELSAKRAAERERLAQSERLAAEQRREQRLSREVRVNASALAPSNSYGAPAFVTRGYYQDEPFQCVGCGKDELWTAMQQKWWYEVAKGYPYSTAKRCRACRRREREARDDSRRAQEAGLRAKAAVGDRAAGQEPATLPSR